MLATVLVFLLAALPAAAAPRLANGHSLTTSARGNTLRFTDFDYVMDNGLAVPEHGWQRSPAERIWWPQDMGWAPETYRAVFVRVRFDRSALGAGPQALFTQDNREELTIFVNGIDVFRNFSRPDEKVKGWYRPYLVPLPQEILRPGINEIVMRVANSDELGVGRIVVGPDSELRPVHDRQWFLRVSGPGAANTIMLAIGGIALFLWAARRREIELLFLALTAAVWFANNLHYFYDRQPVSQSLYSAISLYTIYFAMWANLSFCLFFIDADRKWQISGAVLGVGLAMLLLASLGLVDDAWFYRLTMSMGLLLTYFAWRDLRRTNAVEYRVIAAVLSLAMVVSIHDLGRNSKALWWTGLDFYFQPFLGLMFCVAFLLIYLRRATRAFGALESAKQELEASVAQARAELAASEDKRRVLEVAKAIEGERERIMREVHDGIGANLVTALAVAVHQQHPPESIATLRRALSDLKITVDSLEPFAGDIVALLANFRHRLAPDLDAAGIRCLWHAGECGTLAWLDSANALHLLRIFQEAFGNILAHSGADRIEFGCFELKQAGQSGIGVYLNDNGRGFDMDQPAPAGHGIGNMQSRAQAIGARFGLMSSPGAGVRLSIWLPYKR